MLERNRWPRVLTVLALAAGLVLSPATARAAEEAGPAKGYLGVVLLEKKGEVRILDVSGDSPAARGGLAEGDVVLEVDGAAVSSAADLSARIGALAPGASVRLKVRRDGRELERSAVLEARPERLGRAFPGPRLGPGRLRMLLAPSVRLGVTLQPLTSGLRGYFRAPEGKGVLVSEVTAGSPAERAGIRAGDVLLAVGERAVASRRDVLDALRELEPGARASVTLLRDGAERTLDVDVEARPEGQGELLPAPGPGCEHVRPFEHHLLPPGAVELELEGMGPEARERLRDALEGARESLRDLPVRLEGLEKLERLEKLDELEGPPERLELRLRHRHQEI